MHERRKGVRGLLVRLGLFWAETVGVLFFLCLIFPMPSIYRLFWLSVLGATLGTLLYEALYWKDLR
jgi:hypothetical protein